MNFKIFWLILLAYSMGSINPATLVTYIALKKDIRDFGDRNPGSTNVFLNVNKASGMIVFLLDAAKGFLPIWLAERAGFSGENLAIIGTFVIIGHDFPVFHKFKGGTGVASIIGGLFFLAPYKTIILLSFIFSLIFALSIFKRKFSSNFSPLEVGEAIGFILMLYLVFVNKDYVLRSYMMFSTSVVVLRRFDNVLDIFRNVFRRRHSNA